MVGFLLAVTVAAVTVFTLGAMAPAAACTLTAVGMSAGMSYAAANTVAGVATFTTISAAAVFNGDIAYSKITGESLLMDSLFQGNAKLYNTGLEIVSIATGGLFLAATYGPGICFVEGTLVLTANGFSAIEEIEVGDMVWSENPETGEKELKEVVQTYVNETDELVHVHVNGEEIISTPEHPFYVPKKGWIGAIDLRAGDILVLQRGEYVVVEMVQHEILETPVTVYNFEVEDFHTYYVTGKGVLVHNTCVVKENGVRIESFYPNDHGNPAHLHVYGGGEATKIGPQGLPVAGFPSLSPQQAKVVANNLSTIKRAIKVAQKILRAGK